MPQRKGAVPWNKGRRGVSPETSAKMSVSAKARGGGFATGNQVGKLNAGRPKSIEHRAKLSESHQGIPRVEWSDEVKAKVGASMRHHIETAVDCNCAICRPTLRQTAIEHVLIERVLAEFPEVEPERRFGRFRVDAYLPPPYHLAIEADGGYWHRKRPGHDEARDAYLMERFGLPVVHIPAYLLYAFVPGMEWFSIEGRA